MYLEPDGAAAANYEFAVNGDELEWCPTEKPWGDPPAGVSDDVTDAGAVHDFFKPENNAVVRSFESSMSRGLAGAITSFSMDTAEAPWETSILGSRAPIWVKMAITMKVIHDIPPGLDKDGFNRAPIFNVGKSTNAIAQDARYGTKFASPNDELVKNFKKLRNAMSDPNLDG